MLESNETIFLFASEIRKNVCFGFLGSPFPLKRNSKFQQINKLSVTSFPQNLVLLGRSTSTIHWIQFNVPPEIGIFSVKMVVFKIQKSTYGGVNLIFLLDLLY